MSERAPSCEVDLFSEAIVFQPYALVKFEADENGRPKDAGQSQSRHVGSAQS
jgi:hypothetical protein